METKKKAIVLADDEVLERRVLENRIKKNFGDSCEIYSASNGRQVLELWRAHHPAVLVLDIQMPVITGLEAAEKIRREDKSCAIIFLTAFEDFSYAQRAVRVQAVDYLLKPCEEKELVNAVEAGLAMENRHDNTENTKMKTDHEDSAGGLTERMQAFIEDNYMHDLSVQDMASHFGYADAYFCRIFKQAFGKSFISYLTDLRIQKAKEYLASPQGTISAAGRAVGYEDPNYFAKVFKRAAGCTPTEYRNSVHSAQ